MKKTLKICGNALLFGVLVLVLMYTINTKDETSSRVCMDTSMNITAKFNFGRKKMQKEAVDKTFLQISDLEKEINAISTEKTSENISPHLVKILETSVKYSEITNGYFDVTVAPISKMWKKYKPSNQEIKEKLPLVNYKNISIENNKLTLKNGATLDLGGVAKGYCGDLAWQNLKDAKINDAIIDLGGNIVAVGDKTIGIQKPNATRGDYLGTIKVKDKAVVTAGKYERFIEVDGVKYHHIIDVKTGRPAENNIESVTIVGDSSMVCDILSTSILVTGDISLLENGQSAILIYNDGTYKTFGDLNFTAK